MKARQDNPYDPLTVEPALSGKIAQPRCFSLGNAVVGGVLGVPIVLLLMTFATGVLGGVFRAAPCHSAPDFTTGAMFGVMVGYYILGISAIVVGAIGGALFGGFRRPGNARPPQ